jgi:hypothetical protein
VLILTRLVVLGLAGLLVAAWPAGCGGSDDDSNSATSTKTAPGAEVPPPPLRARDRNAFNEIQRSSGALRAAAVPVAYGSATRIVVADRLNAAARRVARTRPRDRLLARLRRTTLAALGKAASEPARADATSKQIANASIAEANRIDAGLRRYAALHPAANG